MRYFRDERHYVRDVLGYVAANNFVELIVGKRIWDVAQVVNDICVSLRI